MNTSNVIYDKPINNNQQNNSQIKNKHNNSLKLQTSNKEGLNLQEAKLSVRKLNKSNQTTNTQLLNQSLKKNTKAPSLQHNSTEVFSNIGDKSMSLYKNSDQSYYFYTDNTAIKNLVFSGGGAKGVSYLGGVQALEEEGILKNVESCYGSSVGSIATIMVAIGLSSAEITEISDKTKLHGLLMSDKDYDIKTNIPLIEEEDHRPSNIFDQIKAFFNSLHEYFFIENRKGEKLEAYLNYVLGTSLLKKISNNNLLETPELQTIIAKLKQQKKHPKNLANTTTFKDLNVLSTFIPEIKKVESTATAIIDDTPQLVIFNKDNFADMPISTAVRMSSSFPRVFKAVEVKSFLGLQQVQFIDGGCILNTPAPDLIKDIYPHDITQKNNNLIFVFQDVDTITIDQDYNYTDLFKKSFAHDVALKSHEVENRNKLLTIRDQIVAVPTKIKLRAKTIYNHTLNFFISRDESKLFQAKLHENVKQHLSNRYNKQTRYSFSRMEQLFHILSDKDLADINQAQPELCNNIITMRQLGYNTIENIKQAIDNYDNNPLPKAKKDASLIKLLNSLDAQFANDRDFINWFSYYINNSEDNKILRFLDITRNSFNSTSKSEFFNAIHSERQRREHINKVSYIIKSKINPQLYRTKQSNKNKQLLLDAIYQLKNSTTDQQIDNILQFLQNNYQQLKQDKILNFIFNRKKYTFLH
jgi:exoenzyme U